MLHKVPNFEIESIFHGMRAYTCNYPPV